MFGRSFFIAGIMMSLIALPLIVGATREALQSIPTHVREASYALGKDKISTIRRVLLPASRKGIATGVDAGDGPDRRRHRDRHHPPRRHPAPTSRRATTPILSDLTGHRQHPDQLRLPTTRPSGEGNAPEQAYAAAFVLLVDRDPHELRSRPDLPQKE